MAYEQFLEEFARAQGVGSVEQLLSAYADRYSFQINSRDRARKFIDTLEQSMGVSFKGKRVLDVGCAYGSFSIELANRGAKPVGVDISDKWLKLAEINARDEANVPFLNCDASSFRARKELSPYGPFDIVILNDVLEHIYDTPALLDNLRRLSAPDALVYFKVPNGRATRAVLSEGHKKVFGISLLAPDYWSRYITAPFHIYYRRWDYYRALFEQYGFRVAASLNPVTDASIEVTRKHIIGDLGKIRRSLKRENYEKPDQYQFLRRSIALYAEEAKEDIANLDWQELFFKYRVTFWEGTLKRTAGARADAPALHA
jgi:2-polyprenyl-3-methyl-5-hydroxy-6-metoxy-1,4-benzoquinol methylase